MISTLSYALGAFVCRVLPVSLLYRLAHRAADLCWLVRVDQRRAVCGNLRVVLGEAVPEAELRRRGRRVFRNFARRIVDFLRLSRISPGELEGSFIVEGGEHLELARRHSRGAVLFLTAHLGNWEWAAAWLGLEGQMQGVVAKKHRAPAVEALFRRSRAAFGLRVFEERLSAPGLIGLLRSGGSVGMLADRDVTREGVKAQFFGRPARVPRAHVSLALRSGAMILPGFVVCEAGGRNRLIFEPPLDPRELGGVHGGVERCLGVLEKYIRRYPEQWLVFEPVWPGGGVSTAPARALRAAALIPAYQAAASVAEVVRQVRAGSPELEILVVDDGSTDGTGEAAAAAGARVVTHAGNRGKGAALRTGFRELMDRVDAVVTLDADAQHDPAEIPALLSRLEASGAAICVGSRMGDPRGMPWQRRLANRWGSAILSWLAGARLPDTQSGYRVYRCSDLPGLMAGGAGYDYESEVLIAACRSGMLVVFEPISTRYGGERSHFRPLRDGWRFVRLVARNFPGARPVRRSGPAAARRASEAEQSEMSRGAGRGSAW